MIFTDDLDLFHSLQGAEKYFEAWILDLHFEGFDSEGRILNAGTVLQPGKRIFGLIPTQSESISITVTEHFDPEKLKAKLISYLNQVKMDDVKWESISLKEIIEKVIQVKGYTD